MLSSFPVVLNWPPYVSELHHASRPYDEVSVYVWVVGYPYKIDDWLFIIFSRHHTKYPICYGHLVP